MTQVQLTCVSCSPNSPGQFEVIGNGGCGKHTRPYTATQIPRLMEALSTTYHSLLGGLHHSQLEGQGAWKIHEKHCRDYGHITSAHTSGARKQPATLAARDLGNVTYLGTQDEDNTDYGGCLAILPCSSPPCSLSSGVPSFTGSVSVL